MKKIIQLVLLFSLSSFLIAQEIPFLSEEEWDWISNEISGDAAYEHIRVMTQFHRSGGGSPGLMKAAEYTKAEAEKAGLKRVQLIRQPYPRRPWQADYGEIWLTHPKKQLLASTRQVRLHLADYSRTTHIESAEIVDVDSGSSDADYEGVDVAGKIVLAYGSSSDVMREAVWKRGALGILNYPNPSIPGYPANSLNHPDQIHWGRVPMEDGDGKEGTFGFQLSSRQAVELKHLLEEGEVRGAVDIESQFGEEEDAWQVMVEGFIEGSEIRDQDVVLTAHLQEEKFSANDDASGCASTLEIARALNRLIEEGKIKRPVRNIRFWWVTEISSQRQYFADHPEAHESMMVNINQDMVGANQSQGVMRVQNMTRVPFSRFHFLNDVAEAILSFVKEGNRGNLAVLQAGNLGLYPRPVLSRLGTRQRYNAEAIPFHNNTDHMTFNEAPIGVPGITFTNWPDHYIHTSDDDLWNVDRTQLQRNALVVAMIAYTMASASDETIDDIAAEVTGRGLTRIGEDVRLGLDWIQEDPQKVHWAIHQVEQAVERERKAVESLLLIDSQHSKLIHALAKQMTLFGEQSRDLLTEAFVNLYEKDPPEEQLSESELQLERMRPYLVANPADFQEKRQEVESVSGLHSLMAFEALCFVDGKRSGLEIFQAVAAEARRAGVHYYGVVEAEDIQAYLSNLKDASLIDW